MGRKASHATRTASAPLVAVEAVIWQLVNASSSSPSPAYRIVGLPHASQHGLGLSCLQQPPLANVACDRIRERQQEVEDGEPHQYGGLAPSRWRSQKIHHTTATTETPAPITVSVMDSVMKPWPTRNPARTCMTIRTTC